LGMEGPGIGLMLAMMRWMQMILISMEGFCPRGRRAPMGAGRMGRIGGIKMLFWLGGMVYGFWKWVGKFGLNSNLEIY
jgi:hypothetical protein